MTFKRLSSSRGVSLIESLVAIAIFGFGLLGMTRLQLHLVRNDGDAAHRVEAIRLAQQKLEAMRGLQDGIEIASGEDPAKTIGDLAYTRSWTVTGNSTDSQRLATITVKWTAASHTDIDAPSVALSTSISSADPSDAGHLLLVPAGGFIKLIDRRHPSIPPSAIALKGVNEGRSVLKDPSTENVYLVINDANGLVIAHCNFRPGDSASIREECIAHGEALLQGYVVSAEYADASAIRVRNTGSAQGADWSPCEVSRATSAEGRPIGNTYRYRCRVATSPDIHSSTSTPTWQGRLSFPSLSVGISACRYVEDGAPESYTGVKSSLDNQNFVLTAERTCPVGTVLQPIA